MITLRLLGTCLIDVGSVPVTPDAERPFACLLRLALARGRPVPRAELAELLWPQATAPRGRHALRQLLYRLRRLGVPMDASEAWVRLPTGVVARTLDLAPSVEALRAALHTDTWPAGGYFDGYAPRLSAGFAAWLDVTRTGLEGAMRAALGALLIERRAARAGQDLEPIARALLRLDPLNASAAAVLAGRGAADASSTRRWSSLRPPWPAAVSAAPVARAARGTLSSLPEEPEGPPLVGRDALLERIGAALDTAHAGRGGAVLLTGIPGIGKSALGQVAMRAAARRGFACAAVTPRECGDDAAALAMLVATMLELPGALGCAPRPLAVLRRFVTGVRSMASASRVLRSPIVRQLGGALGELLEALCAEAPLLVAVDGVDGLGTSGRAVVGSVMDAAIGRPLLVLLTSRAVPDRETGRGAPECGLRGRALHLPVGPLARADAATLVRAAATRAGARLTASDVEWCVHTGAGIPQALGALAAGCVSAPGLRTLPAALTAAAAERLRELRPAARRLVEVLAIADRPLDGALLADALGMPRHVALGALAELTCTGVLDATAGARLTVQDVLLATAARDVTSAARQMMHAVIAEVLEHEAAAARAPGAPRRRGATARDHGRDALRAAEHWTAAGRIAQAVDVVERTADRLACTGAPHAASRLLLAGSARVARWLPGDDTTAWHVVDRLRARAGTLALYAGDVLTATRATAQGRPAARARGDDSAAGAGLAPPGATLLRDELAWHAGSPWPRLLARARALAGAPHVSPEIRLRAVVLAVAAAEAGASGEPLDDLRQAIDRCAAGRRTDYLRARMIYEVSIGDVEQGLDAAHHLRALLHGRALETDSVPLQLNVAEASYVAGALVDAAEGFAEAFAGAQRVGARTLADRAALRAAAVALEMEQHRDARDWLALLAPDAPRRPRLPMIALELRDLRWRLAIAGGAAADAAAEADAAAASAAGTPSLPARLRRALLTTAAQARLAAGLDVGDALLVPLRAIHEAMADRTLHDRTATAFVGALMRRGAPLEARRAARRYVWGTRRGLAPASGVLAALAQRLGGR